ncbi:MAG TPA: hypothetical protein VHE30_24495 [Polyangiaceae bacterium]|nr:hypothetical protein [Polyangiaceae bacterium]
MTAADFSLEWARAFALTLVVEWAVAIPLLRRFGASLPRVVALVTFAQLVTHPVVWFVLPGLPVPRLAFLVVAETWAWLGEALFYAVTLPALPRRRALGVALLANATSLGLGLAARALGVPV